MDIREVRFVKFVAGSNQFSEINPRPLKEKVKELYESKDGEAGEGIGVRIADEEGAELVVSLSPSNWEMMRGALKRIEKRLPELAAYSVLLKRSGKADSLMSSKWLKLVPIPENIKAVIESIDVSELAEKLKNEGEEYIKKVKIFDEGQLRAALKAVELASQVPIKSDDNEYLQGLAIAVVRGADVQPTNELSELLTEIRNTIIASSVLMEEGAKAFGLKIKREAERLELSGSISILSVMKKSKVIGKLLGARTTGERTRILINELLSLNLRITPAYYESGSAAFPGTALWMCGNSCDVVLIAAGNKKGIKEWVSATVELLK